MAISYFLKIDGITGESRDRIHVNEIEVDSFSVAETEQIVTDGGSGASTVGRVTFSGFDVVARTSAASPPLFVACATGKHVLSAVLTGVRSGKAPHPFLVWTLSDVLVTGFQQSGSADGTFDQFTLQFNKIRIVYTPQKDDGSAGAAVIGEFDRKAGK